MRRIWALFVAALCLAGCGKSDTLSGSVQVDLTFDTFTVSKSGTQLSLAYTLKNGGVVANLVLETEGLALGNGVTLSTADFVKHANVTRAMADASTFPTILQGTIKFDRYSLAKGEQVAGTFSILFIKGTTLNSNFDGKMSN